ncbi:uncharacterized protein MYCFIDRAFT_206237 [Pseudocercospora fijiensis CIRAD86]|uniref:Uncharacterized protein n=1 Tax=Pseudocercospora fijiensis (strain CIRAD86) TaxID=383855 RepID=N1QAZ1_PSEFD|nr:uncharacterized protein MYCFIDRAFT_206237 [Pseudocercospora fijiensis CIRAD86]EME89136.1 hypothetical protein MYCFIDRAFT_206237 [Pseudocercospora fijiensis CIRAD86]
MRPPLDVTNALQLIYLYLAASHGHTIRHQQKQNQKLCSQMPHMTCPALPFPPPSPTFWKHRSYASGTLYTVSSDWHIAPAAAAAATICSTVERLAACVNFVVSAAASTSPPFPSASGHHMRYARREHDLDTRRRTRTICPSEMSAFTPRLLRAVEANDILKIRHVIEEAQGQRQLSRNLLSIGLIRACDKDFADVASFLLSKGADPNYASGNKPPALLRAAEYGLARITETLLDHGADIEAREKKRRTSLMTAAWKGHLDIVKLLLARGASLETVDIRGRNVLHNLAADKGDKKTSGKPTNRPRRKWSIDIVHYILGAGINPDEVDALGRTALHWAAVTDNEEMMKLLLTVRFRGESPQARCNARDSRMKTALHLAASHNRCHLLQVLLAHKADVHARSDGGWTALHNACQSGPWSMVKALIDAACDEEERASLINCELLNGRTPLHVAAEFGNQEAAECLLEQPLLKRGVKDRFGTTPLLMAAQHGKTHIAEMLAPWNHIIDLSEDEKDAAKQFMATIVDFGDFRNENRVTRRSVYELLYARDVKDATKHLISTVPKNVKSTKFRWIHLPANNIAWSETLLTKRFLEEGATDIEGYKALESSFSHQHRGQKHHSRFMRPMCQVVQRTTPEGDESGTPAVIVEEADKLSALPGNSTKGKQNEKHTKAPAQTSDAQASAGADTTAAKKHKSGRPPARQDTTETNSTLATSEASMEPKQIKRQETSSTLGSSGAKRGSKNSANRSKKDPSRQQSRGLSLEKSPSRKGVNSACNVFMFMPYLHFETDRRRQEMQRAVENAERLLARQAVSVFADEVLIRAHLTKSSSFLHVRRTLDQFFYHNIDTHSRDCDQVVYRFQKKNKKDEDVDPKIFMVDQLWMWILGKDLVVTSFPQRWRQPRNDPLNVLEGIIEDINSKTREPVQNVYELAISIAGRCYGTFDRHRKGDDDFQFLDMFEASIGAAMDNEASLFQDFSKASRQASEWLHSHKKPNKFAQHLERESKACEHAAKKHPGKGGDLELHLDESDREPQFVDKLLDVGSETDLLAEIKDIRDELDIIRMVLNHQQHLLPDLQRAITNIYKDERSYAQEKKVHKIFGEQEKIIANPLKDIDRMDKQAERIYGSIRDLLDLKQKHANAFEARFARDQAAGTQRQGQTIMVFTIVTIIFLPLSFISSFFAINVDEFPHPYGPNTSQSLHLSYASAYIFGIGLAISLPCVAAALSVDQINRFAAAIKHRVHARWLKMKAKWYPEAVQHELEALSIENSLSVARSLRRSMDVNGNENSGNLNLNGNGHAKKFVSPVRRSVDSTRDDRENGLGIGPGARKKECEDGYTIALHLFD